MRDLMKRLEEKVDDLPEEDSIKTMMRTWKNNDSQKWCEIIK